MSGRHRGRGPTRRGPYRTPVVALQPPRPEQTQVDVLDETAGDRAFGAWLRSVPDAPARREIVAALVGLLPVCGAQIANTRWGRWLGADLVQVRVKCRRTRGPDPVAVGALIFCQVVRPDLLTVLSAWDAGFEPRIGRIHALRATRNLAGGGRVWDAMKVAHGGNFHSVTVPPSRPSAIRSGHVDEQASPAGTGSTGEESSAGLPVWACAQAGGLGRLVDGVLAEAGGVGDEIARAFVGRCSRYRVACLVSVDRRVHGLTQRELGQLAGVGAWGVARLECAREEVSEETAVRVLAALSAAPAATAVSR